MVALKDGCHHPSNRDTSVGGTYSGCRQNQAWLVIAAFLLAFLREAHMLQDPNNTETDHLFIDTTHVPIYVTLNDLSSCLRLWFIEFPASCRTGRTSAGERLKQVWCHLLTTSVRAPSLLPWGEFWLLSAFAQFCTGASKCAPLSRRALTAAVRFFRTAKNILRCAPLAPPARMLWVSSWAWNCSLAPTDVHHECQTPFKHPFLIFLRSVAPFLHWSLWRWGLRPNWLRTW